MNWASGAGGGHATPGSPAYADSVPGVGHDGHKGATPGGADPSASRSDLGHPLVEGCLAIRVALAVLPLDPCRRIGVLEGYEHRRVLANPTKLNLLTQPALKDACSPLGLGDRSAGSRKRLDDGRCR